MTPNIHLSDEVAAALADGQAVVALESTLITHGLPYPLNVETALAMEHAVRDAGAIPATVAVLKGKLTVGIGEAEVERLGTLAGDSSVRKCSRRDLPIAIGLGEDGATTVAGTMIAAHLAGVRVFATGGIGGVHRGAESTFDISADLTELSQTPVAVVCAGAKSILDIGLTLEYLETKGVPVYGYGTDELPAFYTRKSGFPVDYRVDDPVTMAKALKAKWDLGLHGGALIANPIPEAYSMDEAFITKVIEDAVVEAKEKGVKGKDTTPFLLAKIKEITGGNSLESNIQLVYHNAKVAALVAKEYMNL